MNISQMAKSHSSFFTQMIKSNTFKLNWKFVPNHNNNHHHKHHHWLLRGNLISIVHFFKKLSQSINFFFWKNEIGKKLMELLTPSILQLKIKKSHKKIYLSPFLVIYLFNLFSHLFFSLYYWHHEYCFFWQIKIQFVCLFHERIRHDFLFETIKIRFL